jgi:hypothetical protein
LTSFAVRVCQIYLNYLGVVAGNIQRTVSVRRLEHEDISTRTQSGIGKDVAKYMRMEIRNLSAIIQTLDLDGADCCS